MIEQTTAPTSRINGNRIEVDVAGRQKLLATAYPDGLDLWCKVFSFATRVPYAELMSIPEFRMGVLDVLASEQVALGEPRV